MIIRHCVSRARPCAAARQSLQQPLRRFLSTETAPTDSSAASTTRHLPSLEPQPPGGALDPQTQAHAHTHASPAASRPSDLVAEQYREYKRQQQLIGRLGSDITPHYQPHTLLTNPPSPADVTLELLLAAEAHQGHATSLWNPANARYIHGIRQGIHIISLELTAAHLRRAAKVVQEVSRRAGMVLFVGTRDGQDRAVVRAAELAKGYHLFERWIPGSITNGQQILGRCRLKVLNHKDEEIPGFDEQLWGRPVLRPDLVVCLNPLENYVLLHECALNSIPTIGVIDTNADPTWVTYPIPANDDSLRCIQVIAGVLGRAGEAGQKARLAAAQAGEVVSRTPRGLELPGEKADGAPEAAAKAKPASEEREARDVDKVLAGEQGLENADEVAGKLDDAANREGKEKDGRISVVS